MVYINGVLINSNLWRCLMMCITLINGLVLINAYIGVNHRLQNLLMKIIPHLSPSNYNIKQFKNVFINQVKKHLQFGRSATKDKRIMLEPFSEELFIILF